MSTSSIELKTLAVFASKWTLPVALSLRGRVVRFGVIRAEQRNISQKTLSRSLKLLEHQGLVERRHYPVIPPRVEYRLTDLGEDVIDRIIPLAGLLVQAAAHKELMRHSLPRDSILTSLEKV